MSYKAFIFDLDGTLLDTLSDLAAATNYALREHGLPEHSIDDVRRFVGNGVRKLIERAVPEGINQDTFDRVFATFRQYYIQHSLDTTRPYDGITELLDALEHRGCLMAVVSNKMMAATQQLVAHFFPQITVAIGEDEAAGIRRKPAPDTAIEALRQLGVSTNDAVYIGDSDVDLQTARNAQMPCISVLWGFRDREFLLQHGATTFVSSPEDILNAID